MSNSTNTNPIVYTAAAGSYKAAIAATLGSPSTLLISKIYWFDPTTIGDQVLLTNPQSGQNIIRLRCEVAGQSQVVDWSTRPKLLQDFAIPQLDSGVLYIYIL